MKHPPRFPHEPAPPRPSSPTRVGLGAPEARHTIPREDAITPPHGQTRTDLADWLHRGDAELYVERLKTVEGKVDTLIVDVRALANAVRVQSGNVDTLIKRLDEERKINQEALGRADAQHLIDVSAICKKTEDAIKELDDRIGHPPGGLDMRSSNVEDLTIDQLTAGEREATGLHRLFFQLASTDRKIISAVAQAAGKAAGTRAGTVSAVVTSAAATAPTWIPALVDALTKAFGG